MAAREMGGLSLADALSLCELLANADPARDERAALRWLQRFIDERSPPLNEVALAASALAELRHGKRNVGVDPDASLMIFSECRALGDDHQSVRGRARADQYQRNHGYGSQRTKSHLHCYLLREMEDREIVSPRSNQLLIRARPDGRRAPGTIRSFTFTAASLYVETR
jgi:hypothetical protein